MTPYLAQVSTGRAILIGVAAGLLIVLAFVAFQVGGRRRRARGPDIPPVMKPGPSDADLEKPVLERLYAWGVVFVLLMAVWVPTVFLREPATNRDDTVDMIEESADRGHDISKAGTEENPVGFNCERCHGVGLGGGQNVYNNTVVSVPDLRNVCGGAEFGHPQITSLDDVVRTIAEGRTGTDMPSWSVRFAGAMTDQQIEDVVNYILSIQDVPDDKNVCLNPATPAA